MFDALKKHLVLPSKRLIRHYRHVEEMQSGSNEELFLWCRREADKLNLTKEKRARGLIFDEMTIQENVRFSKVGNCYKITGLVNLSSIHEYYNVLPTGE